MALNTRLQVAALLAANLKAPDHYTGGTRRKESYGEWAGKLLEMADALIAKEKETKPKDNFESKQIL